MYHVKAGMPIVLICFSADTLDHTNLFLYCMNTPRNMDTSDDRCVITLFDFCLYSDNKIFSPSKIITKKNLKCVNVYLPPPTKLDGGYVFTPVRLLAGLLKKLWTDLDEILWGGSP